MIEEPGVRCGIAPGCATDRALVHFDHFVDVLQPIDLVVRERLQIATIEMLAEDRVERVADQCALSTAANTGDTDEFSERKIYRYILQIVSARTLQYDALTTSLPSLFRDLDPHFVAQVFGGDAFALREIMRMTLSDDPST